MTPALDARADRWRAPLQTGAAAGLAWLIASNVAGHHLPVSAPVVAVTAIGAAMTGRARRTMDVMIGVTIGIGLATLLVSIFGHGPLLLAFVVTAAMLAARAAHGGELLVTQAGIAATLVFGAHAGSTDAALARVADALIGAASAGLVSLLVLPPHPIELLKARVDPLLAELADVLERVASALRTGDGDQATAALDRARATSDLVDALHAARPVAVEVARFVPARRGSRELATRMDSASVHLDHAVRNRACSLDPRSRCYPAEQAVRDECASAAATLAEAVRHLDPSSDANSAGVELARYAVDRLAAIHAHNSLRGPRRRGDRKPRHRRRPCVGVVESFWSLSVTRTRGEATNRPHIS